MGHRPEMSGGELLAASGAARGDHLAAADRRHARPKTVPTFADELARLISALHGTNSKIWGRPFENAGLLTDRPTTEAANSTENG
jgi:hypothetical protein